MQTLYARGGGCGGSQQREVADVADGADVVFTDTALHWLKINERIEYKLLSLTYKVLTTGQPDYLCSLISVPPTCTGHAKKK